MDTTGEQPPQEPRKRRYIGVHFECCGVYRYVYYNEKENAYIGNCPFCHKRVRVGVDPEKGISARFFKAK